VENSVKTIRVQEGDKFLQRTGAKNRTFYTGSLGWRRDETGPVGAAAAVAVTGASVRNL